MRIATIKLSSAAPYSASKVFETTEKIAGENHDGFEQRCCRERLNIDQDGKGIIPSTAFAGAIQTAAKRYGGKVQGKGNATWTKHFEAGIMCLTPLALGVTRETVLLEKVFVPSDGIAGSGKRVWKWFPVVPKWGGTIEVHVLDDAITPDVFSRVVDAAFSLVGIGRFRPEKRGIYGRAKVESIKWTNA